MPVIVDDDEIETFPANRADHALDVGILPGRSWSGQHFFHVRPARAHPWRCMSSRKLATATERKRKGGRATDRLEEAWKVTHGPTYRNRIQGAADQGERA